MKNNDIELFISFQTGRRSTQNGGRYPKWANSHQTSSTSSGSSSSADDSADSDVADEVNQNGECDTRRHLKSKKEPKNFRNTQETTENSTKNNSSLTHANFDFRNEKMDPSTTRNVGSIPRSPKLDERHMKIKRENLKSEFSNVEFNSTTNRSIKSPKILIDDKALDKVSYNGDIKTSNANIKREYDKIKLENGNDDGNRLLGAEDLITNNRKKRAPSANSSPYKDKKRKKMFDDIAMEQNLLPPTNHDRIDSDILPPPPQKPLITKVYYSYFERTNDDRDEIREMK